MTDCLQVITTTDAKEKATSIARGVLEARLAACVQIDGPVESHYWWEGHLETAQEWLCIIKTSSERLPELERMIKELHTYETPEIVAVPIIAGNPQYLEWIAAETRSSPR
jgi:periplasmic divalent cation tolerance protein